MGQWSLVNVLMFLSLYWAEFVLLVEYAAVCTVYNSKMMAEILNWSKENKRRIGKKLNQKKKRASHRGLESEH